MPIRRRTATVLAAAALAALAGCSSNHPGGSDQPTGTGLPAGASSQTLPPLPAPWNELDRNDPAAVAVAGINAVFDWRPSEGDTSPAAAVARAAPLLSASFVAHYQTYPVTRPVWQGWMDAHATVTAETSITAEQHPPDTAATWQRKASTTLTITTPGQPASTLTVISMITLAKQPGWTITAITHLI